MVRSSFSQHKEFENCKHCWKLNHIDKVKAITDISYADAGNVVHKILEIYYKDKTQPVEKIKEVFVQEWLKKKLDMSKLRDSSDRYWLMVLAGIELDKEVTSTEFTIFYPHVLGHLDCVNTRTDEIIDWKSSSRRTQENEDEYRQQGMLYAYLYHKKFNKIPSKVIFYYLALNNSNKEMILTPTIEDIKKSEKWYFDILEEMEHCLKTNTFPKCVDEGRECHHFCPYKTICFKDEDSMKFIITILGNNFHIQGEFSEMLHKGIEKKFSYEMKNSFFIKRKFPMANTMIRFWNRKKQTLPIGFLQGVTKTLNDYAEYKKKKLELGIVDNRIFDETKVEMPDKLIGKEMRDYQEEAVENFLKNKQGVLEISTGSGKTLIATEIIRRLGVKTLFIVNKIELLRQSKKVIKESLGIEVGIIGQGEEDIKEVTVATVQTLFKRRKELAEYLRSVRFVVWDENHHTPCRSCMMLSGYLSNTEFKLGLSATSRRTGGDDMSITAVIGEKIMRIGADTLIEKGWLQKPVIQFIEGFMTDADVERMENECSSGLVNEVEKYPVFYQKFIVNNPKRNEAILKVVSKHTDSKILILTKLIEHGRNLNILIPESNHLYGEINKEERVRMINEFVTGEKKVLVSSISLLAEGWDCPSMEVLIMTAGSKSDITTVQVLGRVLRKMSGKNNCFYYDFNDAGKFLSHASYSRKKALRKEGHEVNLININEV